MPTKRMTPKDFAEPLIKVLAQFTEYTANITVQMAETYKPVCELLGIDEDFGGTTEHGSKFTHRNIGLAFRQQLRNKGLGNQARKGEWMLTEEGVTFAKGLTEGSPKQPENGTATEITLVAAKTSTEVEPPEETVAEAVELLRLPVTTAVPVYSEDPYILSLAIENTPCFGAWSKRSSACKACPVAQNCVAQVGVLKGIIAAELHAKDTAALAKEQVDLSERAKKDSSVSELIHQFDRDDGLALAGTKGKFKPGPGQDSADSIADHEGPCVKCTGIIPKGSACIWCRDEGMFHLECIDRT